MRKSTVAACFAASVVMAVAGCSTLGKQAFADPVVNFKELRLNGLGFQGGSVDLVLSVYNPNGYRLDATRLTYNLMLDSVKFGSGILDSKLTVQEKDSTVVHLPIDFTYAGVGEAGRQIMRNGTLNYRVNGDVTVATPVGNFTRPFDRTGRYAVLTGAR